MNIFEKYNIKKISLCAALLILIAIIVYCVNTVNSYKNYLNELNTFNLKVLSIIKEQYPLVSEEEIIQNLNSQSGDIQNVKVLLEKYNIASDDAIMQSLNNKLMDNIIQITILTLLFGMLFFVIIALYIKSNNKKIKEIKKYINDISEMNYTLDIYDNTENNLSDLKNELYKITVMLREQAEISSNEKKAISRAVEDLSHQIKTPLTSISIMLDNIKENENMNKDTRNMFINEISRQIDWINWLTISLLKLSKIDSGTVKFKKENIKVKSLIANVIQNLSIPLEIKNQEIVVTGKENVTFIGDYKWQLEALTNIVKNCIEHTDEGKKIYINLEENNIYTRILIKDEGKGIDKEDLRHIFKRFYKGKNSSENSIGIGLALSKSIIENCGGYITCKSEIDKGCEFEVKYIK